LSSSSRKSKDRRQRAEANRQRTENRLVIVVLLVWLFCSGLCNLSFAATPEPPAVPATYVVDLANIISEDAEMKLNGYLRELEQKTTAQFVILTIDNLDGEDVEGFSIRMAEKWKLGQKGKDNGVLMTVALKDRRYRIEVGYGLESILPDSLVGSIGRGYIVPYFRKGDYSGGVIAATLVVINTIATHEGVEITGLPKVERSSRRRADKIGYSPGIVFLLIIAAILSFLMSCPSGRRGHGGFGGRGGYRGGWYSGGGGFGGGSFGGGGSGGFGGGFGGGGGGGFGGGGASGGW
jgi:uncharacterized protein